MKRYNAKSLRRLCDTRMRKLKAGVLLTQEDAIAFPAAYALDLYDACESSTSGERLDFSSKTFDNIGAAAVMSHAELIRQGKYSPECREVLAKRIGGYLLVSVYNDLCSLDIEPEITSNASDLDSMELSAKAPDGKMYSFDFLKQSRVAMSRFQLSDQGEQFFLFGDLQPLYKRLYKDFMWHVLGEPASKKPEGV